MEIIIRDLEYKLEENEKVLKKYKILGAKKFISATQEYIDDLNRAISVLKAENNTGS